MKLNLQNVLGVVLVIVEGNKMNKYFLFFVFINLFLNTSLANYTNHDTCYIKEQLDYDYLIVEGYRFLVNGNLQMAERIYESAIKNEKCAASAYFQLAKIKLLKGDIYNAERYAEIACRISNESTYLINYVYLLRINGNQKKACSVLKQYLDDGFYNREVINEYISLLVENEQFMPAAKEMKRFKNILSDDLLNRLQITLELKRENFYKVNVLLNNVNTINEEEKYILKAKVYVEFGEYDSLLTLLKVTSNYDIGLKKSIAEVIIKNVNKIKTLDLFRDFININKKDDEFVRWFIQYVVNEAPINFLKSLSLDSIIWNFKNRYYENLDQLFYANLADYYYKIGEYDSLIHQLENIFKYDLKNEFIYIKLIELYFDKSDWSSLLKICEKAINGGINDVRIYYYMGVAFYRLANYENAKRTLESCLNYANEEFKMLVKSILAELYFKLEMFEISDSIFEEVIKNNPDDLTVRNNYAYYLALRNERLCFAEELSKYTIEREKSNASFYDTYAWIMYKKGNYRKAFNYIRLALKINEQNHVIWDHYGSILYKMGKLKMAENAWKKSCDIKNCNFNLKKKIECEK